MPAENELEVKMAVTDPRLFGKILSDPSLLAMESGAGQCTREFEALYYDTADFALQHSGIAYRIRREGDEWVATVKSDKGSGGALFSREELNEKIKSPDPSTKYFFGTNLGERLSLLIGNKRLQPLFSTKFERTTMTLRAGSASLVELALDHGMIWSGAGGTPIAEVELELKEGCVSDLLSLAGWLAAHFHLRPEPMSKYARGLALLDNEERKQEPSRISLTHPLPCSLLPVAIRDIFSAQALGIDARCLPETIRELRIQIRRLRSLLKFFQPFLPQEGLKIHADKLRQWGELLGNIRDLDVLQESWNNFSSRCNLQINDSDNWMGSISERRDFLSATVLHKLEQGELTRNLYELQGWLMQEVKDEAGAAETDNYVRKALIAAVKDLRSELGALEGIPEIKQLHALRIRIKRLRYLLEALSVVPRYHDEAFITATKKLQTLLGKINDVYQIKRLLENFEAGEEQICQRDLFIGWRSRDALRNFFSLPVTFDAVRKAAKIYLHALAALRNGRRTKAGHDADPHEPGQ